MKNKMEVPEIKNYVVFRYNLYMIEYMYEYIVDKLVYKKPIDSNFLLKKAFGKEKKDFLYKMFNTNRTDFSKYKHGNKEEKMVTKKVRSVFAEYPDLEAFIIGDDLIIYNENEEYPSDKDLELSKDTKEGLCRAVDNVWDYVQKRTDMEGLLSEGKVMRLAGWMCIKIIEQCINLKRQEEEIDNVVMREFEHINNISFEMIDECSIRTIENMVKRSKEFNLMLNSIYQYRSQKDKAKKKHNT